MGPPAPPERRRWSLLTLLLVGSSAGVVFWGGFNTVVEATNTEAFCIGCHEMRDNVYKEYSENTIHYTNRTGVRAICPDCHVPKEWGPKMLRKIQASRELYGKVGRHASTRARSSRPSACSSPSASGRA